MRTRKRVIVVCYNSIEVWENRMRAISFYKRGADYCEGCERERYLNIVMDLLDGKAVCSDEQYEMDKIASYNYCVKNGRYSHFDNPNDTRDYGGKIWCPCK